MVTPDRPPRPEPDPTINLRAYFDRMPDEKLRQYRPEWSGARLAAWDGNVKSDGALLLPCCERRVDIGE